MRSIFRFLGFFLALLILFFCWILFETIPIPVREKFVILIYLIGIFVGIIPILIILFMGSRLGELTYMHFWGIHLIDATLNKDQTTNISFRYRRNYFELKGLLIDSNLDEYRTSRIENSLDFKRTIFNRLNSVTNSQKRKAAFEMIDFLKTNSKNISTLSYRGEGNDIYSVVNEGRSINISYNLDLCYDYELLISKVIYKSHIEIDLFNDRFRNKGEYFC